MFTLSRYLFVAILLVGSLFASNATLSGTILKSDGVTKFQGTVTFQLQTAGASNGSLLTNQPVTYRVVNGAIQGLSSVSPPTLVRNDSISPSTTYYVAELRDGYGGYAGMANLYINSSPFDVGSAIQTQITTNNISYANLIGLNTITARVINNVRYASYFPGIDIGAKINNAFADCGGFYCTIVISPGVYNFSTTAYITVPSKIQCPFGATLHYTGTGTGSRGIQMGVDGLNVGTFQVHPYEVEGCEVITDGDYGIYFNSWATYTLLDKVSASATTTTGWPVFYQYENWFNVVDKLRVWYDASPNAARQGVKVNGTATDGTSDNGQSRLVMTNSLIQSLTTAGGHGLWISGAYSSISPNVTVAGLDAVNDYTANGVTYGPKYYFELTSNTTPYAICFGQPSGTHTGAFITQMQFSGYGNLHNTAPNNTTDSAIGPCLAGGTGSGIQNFTIRDSQFNSVGAGTKLIVQNNKASQLNNRAENVLVNDLPVTADQLHTHDTLIDKWYGNSGDWFKVDRPYYFTGVLGFPTSTVMGLEKNDTDTAGFHAVMCGKTAKQTCGVALYNGDDNSEIARLECLTSGRCSWIKGGTTSFQFDATSVYLGVNATTNVASGMGLFGGGLVAGNTTRPTCDAGHRGYFWYAPGGAGVKDTVDVCGKDAADAYAWRTIY